MKKLKSLFSILLISFALITVTSCGDESEDPTPVTNIEKVTATFKGTLTFKSVTVTEGNKSATTSVCEKTELTQAKFSNNDWEKITALPDFIFSGSNNVGYYLPCLLGTPTAPLTWSAVENTNGTVNFTLSNGRSFNIKTSDITSTILKAELVNDKNYIVLYEFTR